MDRLPDNSPRPLIMLLGGEAATQGEQFGVGFGAIGDEIDVAKAVI